MRDIHSIHMMPNINDITYLIHTTYTTLISLITYILIHAIHIIHISHIIHVMYLVGGFNPIKKISNQIGFIFPNFRGENKKTPPRQLLPRKLTCPPKINGWKMYFQIKNSPLKKGTFVRFQGCNIMNIS